MRAQDANYNSNLPIEVDLQELKEIRIEAPQGKRLSHVLNNNQHYLRNESKGLVTIPMPELIYTSKPMHSDMNERRLGSRRQSSLLLSKSVASLPQAPRMPPEIANEPLMRAYADSTLNSRPGNKRTLITYDSNSPGLNKGYMSSSINLGHLEDPGTLKLGSLLDFEVYEKKKLALNKELN